MTRTLEIVRAFARREARTRPPLGVDLGFIALESALLVAVLWQFSRWLGTPVAGARDYLTFAGPPVVLVGFALAAMIAGAATIARARRSGSFEALLVTAATPVSVALGMLAYPAASMFLRALLACAILLFLGLAPLGWGVLAALVSLTLAFAVAAPCAMLLQAAAVARPGALRAAVMAALAGTLLSGAFFPLSELPGGLGGAADLFPFRAMAHAIRLSYGGAPPASLTQAWTALLLWLGLLVPLSWIALDAAFRRARKQGKMRAA